MGKAPEYGHLGLGTRTVHEEGCALVVRRSVLVRNSSA